MNIYEKYGRLAEQLETEQAAHRDTVQVLLKLKTAALRLDQVDVQETPGATNWQTFPDRPAPVPLQVAPESTEIKT